MKYINPTYKIHNITKQELIGKHGFTRFGDTISFRFPVYKHKERPLIFCEFALNEEENQIHVNVVDHNGNSYNYNKEYYGKSLLISKINHKINNEINKLIKAGIINED